MVASMPTVTLDVAFNAGYTTAAASRTWTDVSSYVELGEIGEEIHIRRGRSDEQSVPAPSQLSAVLDNIDGRFTPELTTGAYYPNVKKGRPIRCRVTVPSVIGFDNFSIADSAIGVWDGPGGPGRTETTGKTWVGQTNDWGVISGQAYMPSTGGTVVLDVSQSDVTVECTYTTGAALNLSGLACRYVDDNNRIRVVADSGGGGRWLIQKIVAGVTTNVATGGVAAISTSYAMKVILSGSSVDLYLNNVLTVSATIADAVLLAATKFGLGAGNATDHRWDTFQVTGTATSYRYLGYVDEWPVQWPGGTEKVSTVAVSASSRRARVNRSAAFRSIVEEEILYDSPVLYFPLGEPSGATTAGNIAPGRSEALDVAQVGAGGALTFGAGTGPGTDDLTAPTFTPVDANNGKYLSTTLVAPGWAATDLHVEIECFFSTTETSRSMPLVLLKSADSSRVLFLYVDQATGKLGGVVQGATGSVTVASVATVRDGLVHHVALRATTSGASVDLTLITDGVVATGSGIAATDRYVTLNVGGGTSTAGFGLFSGSIAHVAVLTQPVTAITDARLQVHYTAGATGFSGEASGARIARYARLAGIPTAEISTETGLSTSIAHTDTTGRGPVELMDDVALTEDGVVFDGKDGTLTFHARSHRYNATSALTLDMQQGYVEAGLSPKLDDQGLLNDMSASRSSGVSIRTINQTSIDDHGYYRDSVELMTTSDTEVQNRADWEVNRRAVPRVTIPSVRVNMLAARTVSESLFLALLAADIGTKLTLSNLPANAPATTMDFFIEGIVDEIGRESYFLEFNVSPAALSTVWLLDSASYSQVDSTTVLGY